MVEVAVAGSASPLPSAGGQHRGGCPHTEHTQHSDTPMYYSISILYFFVLLFKKTSILTTVFLYQHCFVIRSSSIEHERWTEHRQSLGTERAATQPTRCGSREGSEAPLGARRCLPQSPLRRRVVKSRTPAAVATESWTICFAFHISNKLFTFVLSWIRLLPSLTGIYLQGHRIPAPHSI